MAEMQTAPAGAGAGRRLLTWVDNRFPLSKLYNEHMAQYYAPKNFNFWYVFGSLALLVLVMQILTGIFLTMHYKPDAAKAFESVEYIMRDVPWGWLVRYMHSTGASAFFIVVYLHMFRGLIYGSYRKPRELVWLFGCAIFLCLMAEAFMGYLLPWGQMSYWGAQVIVNLFSAVPFIGPDLSLLIRGDYVVGDATLNRFFSFHVIAVPLVLLGLVVAHLIALHEVGSNNPDGVEIKDDEGRQRQPARRHPVPSVLHGARHVRGERVPVHLQRGALLRARGRRLLPRVQQLHRGQSAEDAGAHRAGLVLHAVLLDAARDDRPDGQHPGDHPRHRRGAGDPARRLWRRRQDRGRRRRGRRGVPAQDLRRQVLGRRRHGRRGADPVLPALARPQPGEVDPLPARAGTSIVYGVFVVFFLALGYLGSQPPSTVGNYVSQIGTLVYFGFFLLMPWWSRMGTFKPVPDRVTFAVPLICRSRVHR